ncbi:putative porin [Hyphococcus formosus]|uniref:putative porin n=1 Tax=Hyphococcus formosus TaxID=3143534 RepID=UPI00398B595D
MTKNHHIARYFFAIGCAIANPAFAQGPAEIAQIRDELKSLQQLQLELNDRINDLEDRLTQSEPASEHRPEIIKVAQTKPRPKETPQPKASQIRLSLDGDMRVRYEANFSNHDDYNRSRGALRARLRAKYLVNDHIALGGQLSTGDPDDPNSADITLSNFVDDFQVSLDKAYIRSQLGGLNLVAGKFSNPFDRTDRIWDGDVNPQGISGSFDLLESESDSLKAHTLVFLIDEEPVGEDAAMVGGQIELVHQFQPSFRTQFSIGYYDYRLHNTNNADLGDIRTNRYLNGAFLSDFEILSLIARANWTISEQWPLEISGDYSHNFGAIRTNGTHTDDSFGIDLRAGKLSRRGDSRYSYGYAESDVDSTIAAFAQDNIDFGTNYILHSLTFDYALSSSLYFNGSLYHYRLKDMQFAPFGEGTEWRNRLRLNLMAKF